MESLSFHLNIFPFFIKSGPFRRTSDFLMLVNCQQKEPLTFSWQPGWHINWGLFFGFLCVVVPNCVCACVHAQSLGCIQLFCDPVDCSLPGFSVHGILQARILEWVAISSSRGSSLPRDQPVSPALQVDSLPLSRLRSPITFVSFCKKTCLWGLGAAPLGLWDLSSSTKDQTQSPGSESTES